MSSVGRYLYACVYTAQISIPKKIRPKQVQDIRDRSRQNPGDLQGDLLEDEDGKIFWTPKYDYPKVDNNPPKPF